MGKYQQLIALAIFSVLTLVMIFGLFSFDHVNHTICPISIFYGVDCIFMDGAFPLAARKIMTAVVENYTATVFTLVLALIFAVATYSHKKISEFLSRVLLIIKYRVRQAGIFLAITLHNFMSWLVSCNRSADCDPSQI